MTELFQTELQKNKLELSSAVERDTLTALVGGVGELTEIIADSRTGISNVIEQMPELTVAHEIGIYNTCLEYISDSVKCLRRMLDTPTGYPQDTILLENGKEVLPNHNTSPTNIGLGFMSIIASRDMSRSLNDELDFMSDEEADRAIEKMLTSLEDLEDADKYEGFLYNWYDTQSGSVIRYDKENEGKEEDEKKYPFVSTVDNAWLAAGLIILRNASPKHKARADALLNDMHFSILYDESEKKFRGGYTPDTKKFTTYHYGDFNTETRIVYYVDALLAGELPLSCTDIQKYDSTDQESSSSENKQIEPSHGGSMFEALMPSLVVREGEHSTAFRNILYAHIQGQMDHGKIHDKGYYGYSPSHVKKNGVHGYQESGVPGLAKMSGGYGTNHSITFHAIALTFPFFPDTAIATLERLRKEFPETYVKDYGFVDSIRIEDEGYEVATAFLSLDKAMEIISYFIFLAGSDNKMADYFAPTVEEEELLRKIVRQRHPA